MFAIRNLFIMPIQKRRTWMGGGGLSAQHAYNQVMVDSQRVRDLEWDRVRQQTPAMCTYAIYVYICIYAERV